MVEAAMVILTENAYVAGRELLTELDREQMPITDAFWLFREEEQEWRLLLATPLAFSKGPIELYRRIRDAIDQIPADKRGGLLLQDTAVVAPDDDDVKRLRRLYGAVTEERGRGVQRISIRLGEPYIYRLSADGTN